MDAAGGDEEFHARVIEVEMAGLAEVDGQLGAARAVAGVGVFVVAAGIVEEGKEADDLLIGGMVAAQLHAVAQDGQPMGRSVVGGFGKAELGDDELPERDFAGAEWGEVVGWLGEWNHGTVHFTYLFASVRSSTPVSLCHRRHEAYHHNHGEISIYSRLPRTHGKIY